MGCGMFFCRHRESVAQAFRSDVTYMPGKTAGSGDTAAHDVRSAHEFGPVVAPVYRAEALHGAGRARRGGYAGDDRAPDAHGELLRECSGGYGWRIVNSTPLPVVCFTRDGLVPRAFLAALRERQIAWMSEAQLGGVPVVRACITSFRTTEQDIEWVVSEMNSLVSELPVEKDCVKGRYCRASARIEGRMNR